MPTILIGGYYGFGNTGDEAILSAMLNDLRSLQPELEFIVVSGNPGETAAHYNVEAIPWSDIPALLEAVQQCNLIILGGGGLFHDYWGVQTDTLLTRNLTGIPFFSGFPLLAELTKKPCMIYAVGVGPLLYEEGKRLTRFAFEEAKIATVRDIESKNLLQSLSPKCKHVKVTADPAFSLLLDEGGAREALLNAQVRRDGDIPLVGVCLRNWDVNIVPEVWQEQIAPALDRFVESCGCSLIFIPFQNLSGYPLGDDLAVAEEVIAQMHAAKNATILRGNYSPEVIAGILAQCDLVVGMRLHSLIFAAKAGVPTVGVIYDPKVANLMTSLGMGAYALDLNSLTPEQLWMTMNQAWSKRKQIRRSLMTRAGALKKLAKENARLAISLLKYENTDFIRQLALKQTRQLAEREQQIDALQVQTAERKQQIDALLVQTAERKQEIDALLVQTAERKQEIDALLVQAAEREQQNNALHQKIGGLQVQVSERKKRIKALQVQTAEREQWIDALQVQTAERKQEIDALLVQVGDREQVVQTLNGQLWEIQHSKAWKLMMWLRNLRVVIAPVGSSRAKVLSWGLGFLRLIKRFPLHFKHSNERVKSWGSGFLRTIKSFPPRFKERVKSWGPGFLCPIQRFLRRTPPMISWQSYLFHRFKRSRHTVHTQRLYALHCPGRPGLVSIILPVYNGADYVRESIESVLGQTYPDWELIAVDDGSTDATPQILDDYATRDSRVRVIHQPNQRLPSALNTGFRAAAGEFLTWTSSDNRLKPDYLACMLDCLRRHPEWDMAYANMDIIGEDGQPLVNSGWYSGYQTPPGSEHIALPVDPSELNMVANNYVGAAFMYSNRVYYLLGDYSPLRFGAEDYDYWMRVNALFNLCHADFAEQVYEYRFHSTSLTARDEELGISRRREALMVFEDARRDFYQTPLAWVITDSGDPQVRAEADRLRAWVKAAKHILLDQIPFDPEGAHRLWFPFAAVRVTADPGEAGITPELPEMACKVLVVAGATSLPGEAVPSWDMCITTSSSASLPRLNQPRQGWLAVSNVSALCTAIDICVKSAHLARLEGEIANPPPPVVKISVVICTYRRGPQLADAIRSVAQQTFPAEDYEVIIVNNDPLDATAGQIVDELRRFEFSDRPDRLRLIACPFMGLSFARNAGISEACGQVVSFLDDDALAFPDWLAQIWRTFEVYPQAGVVGGKILLKKPDPCPKWLKPGWEPLWGQLIPPNSDMTLVEGWWEFPWGGNWSAPRRALVEMGGFRTGYGRRGADFGGGEEIIAASLIQRLGYAIAVAPQAQIYHTPSADRYTLKYVRKTIHASKFSEYKLQINQYIPGGPDLLSLKKQWWDHLAKAMFSGGLPFYRRIEHWIYFRAVSQVMQRLRADLHERARLFKRASRRKISFEKQSW
jgi:polysaccharide pyruvyl transferase CsaB